MKGPPALGRLASKAALLAPGLRFLNGHDSGLRTRPPRLQVDPPLVGTLLALARKRLWVMEHAGAIRGGICELPLPLGTVTVISSPDLVHEVLVGQADSFAKGSTYRFLRPVIGNGLLTSEREFHHRQRKLMAPAFAHKRIASYATTMAAFAERTANGWADGARIDFAAEMMRLTLAIVAKTLLDTQVDDKAGEVGAAVSTLVRHINSRMSLPLSFLLSDESKDAAARNARVSLDALITRIIRERRNGKTDTGDVLSMLLAAQEEDSGERMTDRQVRDEAMTIFLAGHETTANALSWAFYLLARHPKAYQRLRAEANSVLGGRSPGADDLPRLSYALQVFKEAVRLYPPAYLITRMAVRDVDLGGHRIRAGTDVIVNIYSMQRRQENFPHPERFDPDRFEPAAEKNIPRGAYLPFGAGARICIGNSFALMEGQIVMATLAQRTELTLTSSEEIAPDPLLTLRPRGGVPVRVKRLDAAQGGE